MPYVPGTRVKGDFVLYVPSTRVHESVPVGLVAFDIGGFRWECTGMSGLTPKREFMREYTSLPCLILKSDLVRKLTGLAGLTSK